MERLKSILSFYFTPVIAAVIYILVDKFLHNQGADRLSAVIGLILGVVMVISTFINFSEYGKVMKWLCPILCFVVLIFSITTLSNDTEQGSSGNWPISFGSSYERCTSCRNGNVYCRSSYCNQGKCTRCGGTGIYSHGSYSSTCRICRGGFCKRCNGTGYEDCAVCDGTGKRPK